MTRRGSRMRSFILVELLVIILAAIMLTDVLFVLVSEALYVQRTAAARVDRLAVINDLTQSLRRDVRAATAYQWEDGKLQLETQALDGRHVVQYAIVADQVVRVEDGTESRLWRTARLEFAARREAGRTADIFWLDFQEQPPPKALEPAVRRSSLPLVLPRMEGGRS